MIFIFVESKGKYNHTPLNLKDSGYSLWKNEVILTIIFINILKKLEINFCDGFS